MLNSDVKYGSISDLAKELSVFAATMPFVFVLGPGRGLSSDIPPYDGDFIESFRKKNTEEKYAWFEHYIENADKAIARGYQSLRDCVERGLTRIIITYNIDNYIDKALEGLNADIISLVDDSGYVELNRRFSLAMKNNTRPLVVKMGGDHVSRRYRVRPDRLKDEYSRIVEQYLTNEIFKRPLMLFTFPLNDPELWLNLPSKDASTIWYVDCSRPQVGHRVLEDRNTCFVIDPRASYATFFQTILSDVGPQKPAESDIRNTANGRPSDTQFVRELPSSIEIKYHPDAPSIGGLEISDKLSENSPVKTIGKLLLIPFGLLGAAIITVLLIQILSAVFSKTTSEIAALLILIIIISLLLSSVVIKWYWSFVKPTRINIEDSKKAPEDAANRLFPLLSDLLASVGGWFRNRINNDK